jgi:hypothetical protein
MSTGQGRLPRQLLLVTSREIEIGSTARRADAPNAVVGILAAAASPVATEPEPTLADYSSLT